MISKEEMIEIVKEAYEHNVDIYNIEIVDTRPNIVKSCYKQDCDEETEIHFLENDEYCYQRNPYEDCYTGKIARKIKGKEMWVIFGYEC